MRIGLFSDTYQPEINGVATSVTLLQQSLEELGHEVFVVTTNSSNEQNDKILRLSGIEVKKLYGYKMTSFYSPKAMAAIKLMNLDVIHVHTEFGIGIFGRIAAKRLRIPLIYTYHTMYTDYTYYITKGFFDEPFKKLTGLITKVYAEHCDQLIVPTIKTKEVMLNYGVNQTMNIIPTGLDLKRFNPNNYNQERINNLKRELNIENKDIISYVGRIAKEKSVDIIIDGFNNLLKLDNNFVLVIVGAGPALDSCIEQIKKLGIEENVRIVGKVPYDQIVDYYMLCDVFASASVTETQGLTFIEALACGKPLIARFDHSIEGVLIKDETGEYFTDSDDFAESLLAIKAYGYENYETKCLEIASNYSGDTFAKRVVEVYKNAIESRSDTNE